MSLSFFLKSLSNKLQLLFMSWAILSELISFLLESLVQVCTSSQIVNITFVPYCTL